MTTTLKFDADTCGRCGGTGQYHSGVYGNVCFACNGGGRRLTRAGKAAWARWEAWKQEHLTFPAEQAKAGDTVIVMGRRVRLVEDARVDGEHIMLKSARCSDGVFAGTRIERVPTAADFRAAYAEIAGRGIELITTTTTTEAP